MLLSLLHCVIRRTCALKLRCTLYRFDKQYNCILHLRHRVFGGSEKNCRSVICLLRPLLTIAFCFGTA
jgi:hypothetical protein